MVLSTALDYLKLALTALICLIEELCRFVMLYLSPSYKDLSDDIVLITGAGGGLGRHLCLNFAPTCKSLVLLDVDKDSLDDVVSLVRTSSKTPVHAFVCDLRCEKSIADTAKLVQNEVGRVTVLINNAGIVNGKMMWELSADEIHDCFKVNVLSHFHLVRAFLPDMLGRSNAAGKYLEPRGHVVCVSSVAGRIPVVGLSDYSASKAACLMATEALELELAKLQMNQHIHVTSVLPFIMDTKMFAGCKFAHPGLFPTLSAANCAERILQAVRLNEQVVYWWPRFRFLAWLHALLPSAVLRVLYAFGASDILASQLRRHRGSLESHPSNSD